MTFRLILVSKGNAIGPKNLAPEIRDGHSHQNGQSHSDEFGEGQHYGHSHWTQTHDRAATDSIRPQCAVPIVLLALRRMGQQVVQRFTVA